MKPPRKSSALFELIRKDDHARERLQVPKWWQSRRESDGEAGKASENRLMQFIHWLFHPAGMRMPIGLWLLVLGLVIVLPIGTYYLGKGWSLGRIPRSLEEAREQPVNPQLLRVNKPARNSGVSRRPTADTPVFFKPGSEQDPRQAGLNYFYLEYVSPRFREYTADAVAFLDRNAVDAAVMELDNGMLQLIATKGFAQSSDEAKRHEVLLRTLGKAWKSEYKGGSDWQDLRLFKYKP